MSVDERAPEDLLGKRAASGVLWLAAQKWVVRLSGFATLVILTRRVSPTEFGIVAAAMTVVPMIYLLSDLGFSTYLLQASHLDRRTLSTAFWASVLAGVVLSSALWVVAPLLASAFRIPRLEEVLRALVLSVVPTVLAGVPLALLRRWMRFRALAIQSLVAAVAAQVAAVAVALLGGGVWALVAQIVVSQWVIAVLAWRSARWVPSLWLSPRQFRDMAVFGVRVSSVDLVATTRMWAESWIITVTLGPAALGLLNIGQRLVQVAQEMAAASLVPVSTVVFARVRESAERLRGSYLKALGVAYAVVSPLMVLIAVTAPGLVPVVFGQQWRSSVRPAQALAVAGIITLGAMLDHGLFYGLGRPGSWLAYSVVIDGLTVATTAVAVRWGLTGVAVGFVIVAVVATTARWVLVARLLGLAPRTVARPFISMLPATVAAMLLGELAVALISGTRWNWAGLTLACVVTVGINLVVLRIFSGRVMRDALSVVPLPERHTRRLGRLLMLKPVGEG